MDKSSAGRRYCLERDFLVLSRSSIRIVDREDFCAKRHEFVLSKSEFIDSNRIIKKGF